jgi:hypothetical protein
MPTFRTRLPTSTSFLPVVAILVLCALSFVRFHGVALVTARTAADGTTFLRTRMLFSDSGGIVLRELAGVSTDPAVAANVAREMPRGWALQVGSDHAGNLWSRQRTLASVLWFDSEWNTVAAAPGRYAIRGMRVPYWAAALAVAAPPLLVTLRRRRRDRLHHHRRATGRCVACGYDLRAAPGRCPECGAPAAGA